MIHFSPGLEKKALIRQIGIPIFCFVSLVRSLGGLILLFPIDYPTEKRKTSNLQFFFPSSRPTLPQRYPDMEPFGERCTVFFRCRGGRSAGLMAMLLAVS